MADDTQQSGVVGASRRSKRPDASKNGRPESGKGATQEAKGPAHATVTVNLPQSGVKEVLPEPPDTSARTPEAVIAPVDMDLSGLDPKQNGVLALLRKIERNTARKSVPASAAPVSVDPVVTVQAPVQARRRRGDAQARFVSQHTAQTAHQTLRTPAARQPASVRPDRTRQTREAQAAQAHRQSHTSAQASKERTAIAAATQTATHTPAIATNETAESERSEHADTHTAHTRHQGHDTQRSERQTDAVIASPAQPATASADLAAHSANDPADAPVQEVAKASKPQRAPAKKRTKDAQTSQRTTTQRERARERVSQHTDQAETQTRTTQADPAKPKRARARAKAHDQQDWINTVSHSDTDTQRTKTRSAQPSRSRRETRKNTATQASADTHTAHTRHQGHDTQRSERQTDAVIASPAQPATASADLAAHSANDPADAPVQEVAKASKPQRAPAKKRTKDAQTSQRTTTQRERARERVSQHTDQAETQTRTTQADPAKPKRARARAKAHDQQDWINTVSHSDTDTQRTKTRSAQPSRSRRETRKNTATQASADTSRTQTIDTTESAANTAEDAPAKPTRKGPQRDENGRFISRKDRQSSSSSSETAQDASQRERDKREEAERTEREKSMLERLGEVADAVAHDDSDAAKAVGTAVGGPMYGAAQEIIHAVDQIKDEDSNTRKAYAWLKEKWTSRKGAHNAEDTSASIADAQDTRTSTSVADAQDTRTSTSVADAQDTRTSTSIADAQDTRTSASIADAQDTRTSTSIADAQDTRTSASVDRETSSQITLQQATNDATDSADTVSHKDRLREATRQQRTDNRLTQLKKVTKEGFEDVVDAIKKIRTGGDGGGILSNLFGNKDGASPKGGGAAAGASKALKWGGRALGVLAAPVMGALAYAETKKELETREDLNDTQKSTIATSTGVGTGVGVLGGAAAGAAMGSLAGPVGTLVGGLIGGAIGAWGGQKAGRAIGETMAEKHSDTIEHAVLTEAQAEFEDAQYQTIFNATQDVETQTSAADTMPSQGSMQPEQAQHTLADVTADASETERRAFQTEEDSRQAAHAMTMHSITTTDAAHAADADYGYTLDTMRQAFAPDSSAELTPPALNLDVDGHAVTETALNGQVLTVRVVIDALADTKTYDTSDTAHTHTSALATAKETTLTQGTATPIDPHWATPPAPAQPPPQTKQTNREMSSRWHPATSDLAQLRGGQITSHHSRGSTAAAGLDAVRMDFDDVVVTLMAHDRI